MDNGRQAGILTAVDATRMGRTARRELYLEWRTSIMRQRISQVVFAGGLCVLIASPAWAGGPVQQKVVNTNYAKGGTGVGIGYGGSAKQGQQQEVNNKQIIAPSQSTTYEGTNFDRYAPSIAAPALTSAGTGACLGSFSGGLVGPMAGAMFGKTYESEKCESRMGSALLWQYAQTPGPNQAAFQKASLRVLSGESLKDALAAEGLLPQTAQKVEVKPTRVVSDQRAELSSGAAVVSQSEGQ